MSLAAAAVNAAASVHDQKVDAMTSVEIRKGGTWKELFLHMVQKSSRRTKSGVSCHMRSQKKRRQQSKNPPTNAYLEHRRQEKRGDKHINLHHS